MYKNKAGKFRSDFVIKGKRYQKTWETTSETKAKQLENAWKKEIKESQIQSKGLDWLLKPSAFASAEPMKLSEACEWMYERVWKYNQDDKTPPNRIKTLIKILGDIDINEITDEMLLSLKHRLLVQGFAGRKYAPKTYNHFVSTLRTMMNMLESTKTREFSNKPSFVGVYATEPPAKVISLSDDELLKIRDYFKMVADSKRALPAVEMYEYFVVNSNLGLRPAEYYGLQVGDIDFENNTITISRSVKTHSSSQKIGATKNGLSRTLPIDGLALQTLKKMVERIRIAKEIKLNEAAKLYLSETQGDLKELYYWISKGYFERLRGTPIDKCMLTRLTPKSCEVAWKRMRVALGYDKKPNAKEYSPYLLRHTVASRLVSIKKFSAHKLMVYLGHTNIQTSLKYVHLNADDIRDGCGVGVCE